MRVTVCELRNDADQLTGEWERLVDHVRNQGSELVLLPEMPFYTWVARTRRVNPSEWAKSVKAHAKWLSRFEELKPAVVAGTLPVTIDGKNFNEGFVWEADSGYHAAHTKYYLPDEEGFWEASWYQRGKHDFTAVEIAGVKIGFMICTEQWFLEHARAYARAGVHLIVTPRATPKASADKWVAGGRVAAVTSGAFSLSSCFGGTDQHGMQWAGKGWIIDPEEGDVLALTSPTQPFVTLDIDLNIAEKAKKTYPRYVRE